jgi:hypothetical protein
MEWGLPTYQPARLKLNSSSYSGSKQLDEFASSEGEKKVPEEPHREEIKSGGIITDAEISSVLLLLYDCAVLARDFMAIKQASMEME